MSMKKVLGIIPARAGSKGIPGKNYKLLNGKPLIQYTIEAAMNSLLSKVVISTNCPEVARIGKELGVEVVARPEELCRDDSPTIDAVQYTLKHISDEFEAVMILQPTSPLRTSKHIDDSLKLFCEGNADSLVSVTKVPHNMTPEKIMTLENGLLVGNFQIKRRQDIPDYYARNGAAIYITSLEKTSEYILGGRIIPFIMNKMESFDIDDMEDWAIVEKLIQ